MLGQREGNSGLRARVWRRREGGPRIPGGREQAAKDLGKGVASGTARELRIQVPSECSTVPSDFTYKTQIQR